MSFQEIGGQRTYHKYSELQEPTVLVTGWYTKKDSNHYGIFYEVETEDGAVHVLNSSALLNKRMEDVRLEDFIRVTFTGREILKDGKFKGKPCNMFKVEIDRSKFGKRGGAGILPETPAPTDADKPSDDLGDLL